MHAKTEEPDGGWGWLVVLGAAVTNMLNLALFSQFSLIYGEKLIEMGEGIIGASLAVNITSMIASLIGLIIGPVFTKVSVRQATIVGVILSALGMMLSSLATNLIHVILSFSVFTGLSMGLLLPATFLAIEEYFNERKGQAVGLSVAGMGIGQMLMPHLVRVLLDEYGFRGTTVLLGAVGLNGIPAALLFQSVRNHLKTPDIEKQPLLVHHNLLNKNAKAKLINENEELERSLCQKFANKLQLELLKDFAFVQIVVALAVGFTCNVSFNTVLPFFLQDEVKISKTHTATTVTIISAADLLSRFTLPTVTKSFQISCWTVVVASLGCSAVFRSVLAQINDVRIIFMLAGLCGYARGGIIINQNLAISEYCTNKDVKTKLFGALGLNMLAKGFVVLSLGQVFGCVRGLSGSCILSIQSIILMIIAVSCVVEVVVRRIRLGTYFEQ